MQMKSHHELTLCSYEDKKLFDEITAGLPSREGYGGNYYDHHEKEIPFGSEAHVLKYVRDAVQIVNPSQILEIGLNRGHGSAMFLALSKAKVVSIDISDRKETVHAGIRLKHLYPARFDFFICDSAKVFNGLKQYSFDMCFVDGAHDRLSVIVDINLCKNLKVPFILFDDCYPRYGEVLEAIGQYDDELELIKDMDNLRLYKTNWK
jgi:predicted O-methyltransferase YrrM